jgi:hypothetical protein
MKHCITRGFLMYYRGCIVLQKMYCITEDIMYYRGCVVLQRMCCITEDVLYYRRYKYDIYGNNAHKRRWLRLNTITKGFVLLLWFCNTGEPFMGVIINLRGGLFKFNN